MRRRTYNDPGHAHELTFSVYRRTRLFDDAVACRCFLAGLDAVRARHGYEVWAYVLMPDHVHLLVWPKEPGYRIETFRQAVKGRFARDTLARLEDDGDPRLARFVLQGRRRLWQPGAGYDRNLYSSQALLASVEYIHANPVLAGLAARASDWQWSSAAWYEGLRPVPFEVDPLRR